MKMPTAVQADSLLLTIDGKEVKISNPDKVLWPELNLTKMAFLQIMMNLAPYLLKYSRQRLLTVIRFPDGIHGESFYQKNVPSYAPDWIERKKWQNTEYVLLNNRAALAWLVNSAALEFHTAFNYIYEAGPSDLVFDLDPSVNEFAQVAELALDIKACMDNLGLKSHVKTSGSTGLQVYIPIEPRYTYDQAREVNHFLAKYFAEKHPQKVTIERLVKNRGTRIYFDYLQMWEGKTIAAPYTPRANPEGKVSAPLSWDELSQGARPEDFTLLTIERRLEKMGDLFADKLKEKQSIDHILQFIAKTRRD